jgi:hypothetical protein
MVMRTANTTPPKIRHFELSPQAWPEQTVPVIRAVPDDSDYVHTYYDICPFSPSGRYLAVTRLPYGDHSARFGDTADVCVVDLCEQTIRTVYSARCWGFQTGAGLMWGTTEDWLYTNDMHNGRALCHCVNIDSGEVRVFPGPLGHIAPDESGIIGFPVELRNVTQQGYGMPSPDPSAPEVLPPGAAEDQGIWYTDTTSGSTTLLLSLAEAAAHLPEPPPEPGGTFYFWHTKFSPDGNRIMYVLRALLPSGAGRRNPTVFTCNHDGTDIHFLPGNPVWGGIGGHPSWTPDSQYVLRNIKDSDGHAMHLGRVRPDGREFEILCPHIPGGGHPTLDPGGQYVITDELRHDQSGTRTVSLRLINVTEACEHTLCTVGTIPLFIPQPGGGRQPLDAALRLDGHPAWSRDGRNVCFQAAPERRRQVFIADLSGFPGGDNACPADPGERT